MVFVEMLAVTQLLTMFDREASHDSPHFPLSPLNRNSWVIFALVTMVTTVKV